VTSRAPRLAAALAAALLLAGCSGGGSAGEPAGTPSGSGTTHADAAACDDAIDAVVDTTQRYVDRYDTAVAGGRPEGRAPDLEQELASARSELEALGCDPQAAADRLSTGLSEVEARGALADAVKRQLVASMTGKASTVAATRKVGTDDDLRDVLPQLAPGSTVRLSAGDHRLRDTVVLLQGVRLVGAGRGRTTLTTSAADVGILAISQDRVDLRDLTLRHVGDEAASLLLGGSSSSLVLDRVVVSGGSGATGDRRGGNAQAAGGSGVLMAAGQRADGGRATTLQVTDSLFRDNEAAGILLSGGHVASVIGSSFTGNGQCGICFVGDSSGAVRDSRFQGGVTGMIAADRAAPLLVDSTVRGGEIGVQAVDRASPVVRRTTVAAARRAALLFGDRSRGRVESVTCRESRFDIVVTPDALPFLGDNRCSVQPTG
jgi:hypothetical protein